MRLFGREAAEIVPHAGDDVRDLGLTTLRKGAADVASSMFENAQKRASTACQRAAESRSAIEGQNLETAEQRDRPPSL
jgi:hypothetical protein